MTGNVRDNCYPHIHFLPTHLHLAFADFICLLPFATSAHLQIRTKICLLPIVCARFVCHRSASTGVLFENMYFARYLSDTFWVWCFDSNNNFVPDFL